VIAERIRCNDYACRTFLQRYFWRNQQKKEVGLIENEGGVMKGYKIKRKRKRKGKGKGKDSKSVKAPAISQLHTLMHASSTSSQAN
jgi:hypothetical protein